MSEHARPAGPGATFALRVDELILDPGELDPSSVIEGTPEVTEATLWTSEDGRIIRGVWQITEGTVTDVEADEVFVVVSGQRDGRGGGWRDPRARARRDGRARPRGPHDLDRARAVAQGLPDHAAGLMVAIDARLRSTYADASWTPFWLDREDRPAARPALEGEQTVDLAIVGAGFTGLWAALQALEDTPGREVMLLEGERVAFGASGRNGGFCEASLTHGLDNGIQRFPTEIERIEQEGRDNLAGIAEAIERYEIDCAWEPTGTLVVANEPHQVQWCRDAVPHLAEYGHDVAFLDREAVRAEVDSPTYIGGFWRKDGGACIDPARLAWGWQPPPKGSARGSMSTRRSPRSRKTVTR